MKILKFEASNQLICEKVIEIKIYSVKMNLIMESIMTPKCIFFSYLFVYMSLMGINPRYPIINSEKSIHFPGPKELYF